MMGSQPPPFVSCVCPCEAGKRCSGRRLCQVNKKCHAGLIRTVRGTQGGHTLARHPADINLRQIYHVFEGTEGFVECTTDPEYCQRTDGCVTQEVWAHMYGVCMQILEATTLEDLTRRAQERIQEEIA